MFDFIKRNPFLCLFIFLLIVSPSFLYGVGVVALVILAIIAFAGLMLWWKIRTFQKQARAAQQQWNANAQGSYGQSQGSYGQSQGEPQREPKSRTRKRHSGDVDIKIVDPTKGKRVADDVGDYVDFEEIKEK